MQPRYAKVFPETQVSLQSPSSCRLSWRIGTGRSYPTLRHVSTIAQQWLHLNDYCRGNPDRRPVGSADQTDDRFAAMSSKVCNSAMSSATVGRIDESAVCSSPIADLERHITITHICWQGWRCERAVQTRSLLNLLRVSVGALSVVPVGGDLL